MATIKYYVKHGKLLITLLLMVIKEPNLWQTRAYAFAFMIVYFLFIFLICIFMNINEYVKINEKTVKLHTPDIMEAHCAHILPRLYLTSTNMSVSVC